MNSLTKKIATLSAAAVITLGGLTAFAQTQGPGGRRGPGFHAGFLSGRMAQALNLTDAQKEQIRSIVKESFQSNKALGEQLKTARQAEREAVKAGKSDAELAQLAQNAAPLHAQFHAARLQTEAKVYKVLTPEQQTKLEEMRAHMRERFGKAAQRFGHRRGNPAPAQQ